MDSEFYLIWQDREIRFDVPPVQLQLRRGEVEIDSINAVEDTKGNNGEQGMMIVTNLRVIWIAHRNHKTNLSIGLNCIISANIRMASSKLKGNTQALHLHTRYNNNRFEFIFTSLVKNSPRLFTTIQAVFRSYETSKLYRDLKLRGAIIKEKDLIMLPHEQLYSKVNGVWNLSSDQGNLGSFFVTNVRVVWFANLAENFNVSIPYLQIRTIRIRDSKFGSALVIETTPASGGYILGFRTDPFERLEEVYKEIHGLHQLFSNNPIFGVDYVIEEKPSSIQELQVSRKADDVEIVSEESLIDTAAAYYADGRAEGDREPVYDAELGLAVEKLKEGFSIQNLWSVV